MRRVNWILVLFISFFTHTGCVSQASYLAPPSTPDPYRRAFTPVTWEIVREIANQDPAARNIVFEDLNYFLSGSISLVSTDTERRLKARDGRLVVSGGNLPVEKRITSLDRGTGRFINTPVGNESFEVAFPESASSNLLFIFERNQEKNNFELVSIRDSISGRNYSLQYSGRPPYLRVFLYYRRGGVTTVLRNPVDVTLVNWREDPRPFIQPALAVQPLAAGQGIPASLPIPISLPGHSGEIIGAGFLDIDRITGFIASRGSTMLYSTIREVISVYIDEARIEGINHDIAIAIMLNATNFLSRPGILRTHNYGGLGQMGGEAVRFANMRTGIRAHIQQMKVHASRQNTVNQIVDEVRFNAVRANTDRRFPRTLNELLPVWQSENPTIYRHDINLILTGIYNYQLRTR